MESSNDNSTWQTLAAATARLLQGYENQNESGEGNTKARRTDQENTRDNGSDIDQRRAATG